MEDSTCFLLRSSSYHVSGEHVGGGSCYITPSDQGDVVIDYTAQWLKHPVAMEACSTRAH